MTAAESRYEGDGDPTAQDDMARRRELPEPTIFDAPIAEDHDLAEVGIADAEYVLAWLRQNEAPENIIELQERATRILVAEREIAYRNGYIACQGDVLRMLRKAKP